MKVSAILLAAGLSRRMGTDKLLLDYKGKTFLQHSIDLLSELPVYERIVVTTDARLELVNMPPGIRPYINPKPESGQSGSIRIGVEVATGSHYIFLTADQPKLTPDDIASLLEAAVLKPDKIVYPKIKSKPTSPTIFPNSCRKKLLELTGDTGGREIRDKNPESCFAIEPEHIKNFVDIDSEEEYHELF